ncbi:AAA family ATPase [Micromonospora saelicesensis]|uniref:AAA family ATPase n=1 Tax=Micromonospora saelicesensis TaxID=285676 RepID=UPI003CF79F99
MTAELKAPMTEDLVWANVMRPRIPLVYLDLNTIIYIARALSGDTKVPESYVHLHKAALRAKFERRAMFPLSGEHLWEISKITNPKQRGDLADILETASRPCPSGFGTSSTIMKLEGNDQQRDRPALDPPCSGKTTAGSVLAAERSSPGHGRIHLEVDTLFDLLFPGSDRNRDDRLRAYDGTHLLARMFVDHGETVVLEFTYARRDQRASLLKALAGSSASLWVVEFFVTPQEAVSRFRERRQATDLDEALVRERADAFPYFDEALRVESSAGTPEDHAQSIITWLQQGPRPVCPRGVDSGWKGLELRAALSSATSRARLCCARHATSPT